MLDVKTPEKNLSVHESMMLWCRRLVFRQYDGFVSTVEAYGGRGLYDEHNLDQTAAIVLKLMKPFLNKGYHAFIDN